MNLKELGSLLVILYIGSCLLVAYKYYRSRGKVFKISKLVIVKYLLRFCVLILVLFLLFNTINQHNKPFASEAQKEKIVFVIAKNSSISTWNMMQKAVSTANDAGLFSLVEFTTETKSLELLIPFTNQDAFVNLLSQPRTNRRKMAKILITNGATSYPDSEQFYQYKVVGDKWVSSSSEEKIASFFSFDLTNTWFSISFLNVYLVILSVLLVSIDLIFTIKAIKK
jgi:hypothetical protein